MKYLLCFLVIFGMAHSNLWAQSKVELEQKRKRINQQIARTNRLLQQTSVDRKVRLKKIKSLQQQIGSREVLIENLETYLQQLDSTMLRKVLVVEALGQDLVQAKSAYKDILRTWYRLHLKQQSSLLDIASKKAAAQSQQVAHYQQLEQTRRVQIRYIQCVQDDLSSHLEALSVHQTEKNLLLEEEQKEKSQLAKEKQTYRKLVQRLSSKERQLKKNLQSQKQSKRQLSKKIEQVILAQIEAAKRAARKAPPKVAKRSPNRVTPQTPALFSTPSYAPGFMDPASLAFAQQKGRLRSPVYHGVVVGKFGRHQHPKFKDVIVNNNGIDIKGQYNSVVQSVYQGTVVSIFTIPGYHNAVMVKHGNFYTTYSNIAKVYVKQGQQIKTGGQLGTVARAPDGKGHVMHFEIWHNKEKQNPSQWLRSRL